MNSPTTKKYRFVLVNSYGRVAYFPPFVLVRRSIYRMHSKGANVLTFWKKLFLRKTRYVGSPLIVIHHAWHDNYYHWTLECLPWLLVCAKKYPEFGLLLPNTIKSFQKQQIELLGFSMDKIKWINEDEQIIASNLVVCPLSHVQFAVHNFQLVTPMLDKFKSNLTLPPNSTSKYYLSRANSPKRKAANENEVMGLMKQNGFEVIVVEQFSVLDQFRLFSNAQIVVGVHGSFFVNAFAMRKGGIVIDIMEKQHDDPCYYNLLTPLGINYYFLLSQGVGDPNNYRDNDVMVDLNSLQHMLSTFSV